VSERVRRPDPPLSYGSIRLDPLTQADAKDAWAMVQDEAIIRFTYLPTSADETFISHWIGRYERGWEDGSRAGFAIRGVDDRTYLGFAAIVHLDLENRQGEIGYMLAREARGRGAAAAAVELLTRWGFDELGLERLELRIDDANEPSKRVAERAGYRFEGVLRSLAFKEGLRTDTGIWSRLPGDSVTV
jgi:RimJ/RimL family protein N-acetyltransferase